MSVRTLKMSALAGRSPGGGTLPEIRMSTLKGCVRTIATWIVRGGERRALRELASAKRLLNDIGLTREQALGEAGKHFRRR